MAYNRMCFDCKCVLSYKLKGDYNRANKQNRKCKSCASKKTNRRIKLERNCPKCGTVLIYLSYHGWWWSKKHNLCCRSCVKTGKIMPDGFSAKISKIVTGSGNPMFGRNHTDETKMAISINNKGNKSKTNQIISENTKQKMRESVCNRVTKYGFHKRGFNPNACKYIDDLREYRFQHALNGGEFCFKGYFADGYDNCKNVWIEYDESQHFDRNGNLKQKDIERMNKIKLNLGCKFLRYNELTKELKEW